MHHVHFALRCEELPIHRIKHVPYALNREELFHLNAEAIWYADTHIRRQLQAMPQSITRK